MAKIRAYLHGQLLSELALLPGQEYFAGRGSQSHILLSAERGISRQHIKIFLQDNIWRAQLTSKYGGMVFGGQSVETVELKGTTQFSIPPYEFIFDEVETIEATAPIISQAQENTQPKLSNSQVDIEPAAAGDGEIDTGPQATISSSQPSFSQNTGSKNGSVSQSQIPTPAPAPEQTGSGATERTMVVKRENLIPYLKIVNNKLKTEEVLKLEGSKWRLGRHPDCEVMVNDSAISRKHFEITLKDGQYFVTDEGSSNGTAVNGVKIEMSVPRVLNSGDVLTVRHLEFILELHDSAYEDKVQSLPKEFDMPVEFSNEDFDNAADLEIAAMVPSTIEPADTGVVLRVNKRVSASKKKVQKKWVVRGAIAALVLLALYFAFAPDDTSKPNKKDLGSNDPREPKSLSQDQRKQIVDIFNLAHNYYSEKKYTLCLSQLEKLTVLTPFYLNSKELQNLCEQGQENEARALDRERHEQEKRETENQIQANVDECRNKMASIKTSLEMRSCLDRALQLDPENPSVKDIMQQIAIREEQTKDTENKAAEFRRRKQDGEHAFSVAESNYQKGQQKQALGQFKKFLNGHYPGLNQQEDTATRRIASIQKTLDEQTAAQIGVCQAALDKAELRPAIEACDRVLAEKPGDPKAKELRQKAYSQLLREMKQLYEDSVLEENMGNLESAKDKWNKILDRSIPEDGYYRKAKVKLKKYGIGM